MKKIFVLVLTSLLLTQLTFAEQFKHKNIIYNQIDDEITLVKYRGTDAEVSIPKALNKIPVTKLEKRAFAKNNYIEKLTLPSTITKISEEAFADCENLTLICYYAKNLTIEKNAFLNCKNITLVQLKVPEKGSSPKSTDNSPAINEAENGESETDEEVPSVEDIKIVNFRQEYIDTSLTFARILEKAYTHYDQENDDLPIEYITEVYTYLDVFLAAQEDFYSAVGERYGQDEIESGNPQNISVWMPEKEKLALLSYLNRIDTVMLHMGLNTPSNSFEAAARMRYNTNN